MNQIINQEMTDFAVNIIPDYMQSMQEALGLAPIVATGQRAGRYMKFDTKQAFLVPEASRATGGDTRMVQFNGEWMDYVMDANALKTYLDVEIEVPLAGAAANLLERAKVKNLLAQSANAFTCSVLDAVREKTAPVSGLGDWANDDVDPLDEIMACIESVEAKSGLTPNVVTMSKGMWRLLRKHPKVLARFPGKVGAITRTLIEEELGESGLAIEMVTGRGFRTSNLGKKGDLTVPFMGDSVYVHYRDRFQSNDSPSFAATLSETENMITNVYEYMTDDGTRRFFRIPWMVKVVIKSNLLIARIDKK